MKQKVKGSFTIEATMVVPFIMICTMIVVWLMVKEYYNNMEMSQLQAGVTLSNERLFYPLILDENVKDTKTEDAAEAINMRYWTKQEIYGRYIKVPVISAGTRNVTRLKSRVVLGEE